MALSVTDSPDILSLDSKITASLCDSLFHVDVTPSEYVSGREDDVLGANVKIVNPAGVTIKEYSTSGYDIEQPLTGVVEVAIPLIANNFQYGTYQVSVEMYDSYGTPYELTKPVNICVPNKNDKTKKKGCISAKINASCSGGQVVIYIDNPPTYKGQISTTQTNAFKVYYPTESELTPLETEETAISVALFTGEYKVTGTVCAEYAYGDNVFFKILYDVKCSKQIKCFLDKACVDAALRREWLALENACGEAEISEATGNIFKANALIILIDFAASAGTDPSEYVTKLENILGCNCTCSCNSSTPITYQTPILLP